MKNYKYVIMLCVLLWVSACASTKDSPQVDTKPAVVELMTKSGQVYKRELNIESTAWADSEIARSNSECWVGISQTSGLSALPAGATTEQTLAWGLTNVTTQLAKSLSNQSSTVNPCPLATNSNDVGVAVEDGKTKRSVAKTEAVQSVVGSVMNGALIYKGISTAGKVVGSFVDGMGTTNNIEAGGDVKGAFGEGNTYTEEIGGIPLNNGDLTEVALGSTTPIEETIDPASCDEPREFIPSVNDPLEDVSGCFDTNGDGQVCSTGGGCFDI